MEQPTMIEQRVLELVKLGLRVHDIASLLNTHPRAIERFCHER